MKTIILPLFKSLLISILPAMLISFLFSVIFEGKIIQDVYDVQESIFNKNLALLLILIFFSELLRLINKNSESESCLPTILICFIVMIVVFLVFGYHS